MKRDNLFEILNREVKHRIDIYMAPSKIDKYFRDQGFPVNEISKSDKEGQELGVSIFKVVSGKISGGQDTTEKIVLDSRDKGKIIDVISFDDTEKINSGLNASINGLIQYKGPAMFTYWDEEMDACTPEQNTIIQKERTRQERILEKRTLLFSFRINETIYVSIASKENFDLGMLASYGPLESHCLLGMVERKLTDSMVLINPFWIWHEH